MVPKCDLKWTKTLVQRTLFCAACGRTTKRETDGARANHSSLGSQRKTASRANALRDLLGDRTCTENSHFQVKMKLRLQIPWDWQQEVERQNWVSHSPPAREKEEELKRLKMWPGKLRKLGEWVAAQLWQYCHQNVAALLPKRELWRLGKLGQRSTLNWWRLRQLSRGTNGLLPTYLDYLQACDVRKAGKEDVRQACTKSQNCFPPSQG